MIFYLKTNLSLKRTNFKVIFAYDVLFLRYQWFKFGIFFHTSYNNPQGLMRKNQNLTPPISQYQHQPGTSIQFFLSFYHKNYEFLIDTFESKNNWYFSGFKYLAEFWFYALLTHIGNILGLSPSVIFGNKIQKLFFANFRQLWRHTLQLGSDVICGSEGTS